MMLSSRSDEFGLVPERRDETGENDAACNGCAGTVSTNSTANNSVRTLRLTIASKTRNTVGMHRVIAVMV
jgi:hypothetical protein